MQLIRDPDQPSHQILLLLWQHRVMTTRQVARATGVPERTASYRLARTRAHGLTGSDRPGRESGSAGGHWWLRPAGARLVAGVPLTRRERAPSGLHLKHAAAITDVWLALTLDGPGLGLRLDGWAIDQEGWEEVGAGSDERITPDAVAELAVTAGPAAGQTVTVYIEVDLATMTHSRLGGKVVRYLKAAGRAWQPGAGAVPVLLLLTTSQARVDTFIARAAKIVGKQEQRAGSFRGDEAVDVAAAGRLYVAGSPHVTRPAVALSSGWLLAPSTRAEETTVVDLAGMLAERAVLGARVDRLQARKAEASKAAAVGHRLDALIRRDGYRRRPGTYGWLVDRLDDPTAVAALDHLADRFGPHRLHVELPDLAAALFAADDAGLATGRATDLLAGADGGGDPEPVDALRALLRAAHDRVWAAQVGRLLDAGAHLDRDHPRLWAWARQLHEGRLLATRDEDALTAAPASYDKPRTEVEAAHLARYRRDQAAGIAARLEDMSRWARRRFDVAAVTAAADEVGLVACDTCAVITARGEDTVYAEGGQGDECWACRGGRLLEYGDRDQIVTLATRLDELRRRTGR